MGMSLEKLRKRNVLQPSNGRDSGSLFTNPVARAVNPEVDIHDTQELARIMANARKNGLVRGGEASVEKRAKAKAVERLGVSVGLGDGAACGVPAGVRTTWMDVTARIAADWLGNNFRNRPLREDTVLSYARDMVCGRWTRTHQGIAFNDRDELVDGQHRLSAVMVAEKSVPGIKVPMMVTYGLPSKIADSKMTMMDAVDRGATRSVADQLKIQHGMKNGSVVAMVTKSLALLCCPNRLKRLTVGETLEIYGAFGAAVDEVISLRPREHGLKSAGVLAGFAFAATARGKSDFGDFVAGKLPVQSALGLMRDFLTSDAARLLMRSSDRALAMAVLNAIAADENGVAVGNVSEMIEGDSGLARYRELILPTVQRVVRIFNL